MTRTEFIRLSTLLGISIPFSGVIHACSTDDTTTPLSADGKVLVIGAGPAGMAAGHLLAQQGIDFQILEATGSFGGRIKHTRDFAGFPISLGGEWIHVNTSILSETVNDSSITISTQTQGYDFGEDQIAFFDGTNLSYMSLREGFGSDFIDHKFVDSSWLDFFETYLAPGISSKTIFNTPITAIDYSGDQVIASTANGTTYSGDKIIVTVPVKILQTNRIQFTPTLPSQKLTALRDVKVWGGFKAFIKFSERFYPSFLSFPDSETNAGQRVYYDAAYAQTTGEHILGLFSVGQQAEPYQNRSGDELKNYILNELDTVFGNALASTNYVDHIVQNWNEEPYAQAAYIRDEENWRLMARLGEPVGDSLYFAGDGYTDGEDWSSVHTAVRAAKRAVDALVG